MNQPQVKSNATKILEEALTQHVKMQNLIIKMETDSASIASEAEQPKSEFATIMGIEDNERTKDWPKHDPDPAHCSGHGHAQCVRDGQHSWFNHSQDSFHSSNASNLPEGFIEP